MQNRTAPGHPATNSLAEGYVGEFRDKLNKLGDTGETVQTKRDMFLLTHRATPTSLRKSPSELLMNRQDKISLCACRILEKAQNGSQVELQKQSVQELLMLKLAIHCGNDMRNNFDLDTSLPTSVQIERVNSRSLIFWGALRSY